MSNISLRFLQRRTSTVGRVPAVDALCRGELYLQLADKTIYFVDSTGGLVSVLTDGQCFGINKIKFSGAASGDLPLWNGSQFVNFSTGSFSFNTGNFVVCSQLNQYVLCSNTGMFATTGYLSIPLTALRQDSATDGAVLCWSGGCWRAGIAGGGNIDLSAYLQTGQTGQFESSGYSRTCFVNTGQTGMFATTGISSVPLNVLKQESAVEGSVLCWSGGCWRAGTVAVGNLDLSNYVQTGQTGNFVTKSQTGDFASAAGTGNFVTKSQTGDFASAAGTGNFVTTGQTGDFASAAGTGNFVTKSQTGDFASAAGTGNFVTTGQTGIFATTGDLSIPLKALAQNSAIDGSILCWSGGCWRAGTAAGGEGVDLSAYVQTGQTGVFALASNYPIFDVTSTPAEFYTLIYCFNQNTSCYFLTPASMNYALAYGSTNVLISDGANNLHGGGTGSNNIPNSSNGILLSSDNSLFNTANYAAVLSSSYTNISASSYSYAFGCCNTINNGIGNFLFGFCNCTLNLQNVFILGCGITADTCNSTYVNNLVACNNVCVYGDICSCGVICMMNCNSVLGRNSSLCSNLLEDVIILGCGIVGDANNTTFTNNLEVKCDLIVEGKLCANEICGTGDFLDLKLFCDDSVGSFLTLNVDSLDPSNRYWDTTPPVSAEGDILVWEACSSCWKVANTGALVGIPSPSSPSYGSFLFYDASACAWLASTTPTSDGEFYTWNAALSNWTIKNSSDFIISPVCPSNGSVLYYDTTTYCNWINSSAPSAQGDFLVWNAAGYWEIGNTCSFLIVPSAGGGISAGCVLCFDGTTWGAGSIDCDTLIPCPPSPTVGYVLCFDGSTWTAAIAASADLSTVIPCPLAASAGNVLCFDGSTWTAASAASADLSTVIPCPSSPTAGYVLCFDGSTWVAASAASADLSAVICCPAGPAAGDILTYDGTNWIACCQAACSTYISCPQITSLFPNAVLRWDGYSWNPSNAVENLSTVIPCPSAPDFGCFLMFDGTNWSPATPPEADFSDLIYRPISPLEGDVLCYDGSTWIAATAASADLSNVICRPSSPAIGNILCYDGVNWIAAVADSPDFSSVICCPSSAAEGCVLCYDGSAWIAATAASADLSNVICRPVGPGIGYTLCWDGNDWVAATIEDQLQALSGYLISILCACS